MKIVIINGKGGVGKDTFVTMCQDVLGAEYVYNISTVDFVKEVAEFCGWDGTKTPENRKFLSDLKDVLTDWKDIPLRKVVTAVSAYTGAAKLSGTNNKSVAFIHCREPKEIDKLTKELQNYEPVTLLMRRDAAENVQQTNHADNDVLNYSYDYIIHNNHSLSALRAQAEIFLREYLELDI